MTLTATSSRQKKATVRLPRQRCTFAAIKSVKGIGLKTAQRIIIDLKDKIKGIGGDAITLSTAAATVNNEVVDGATSALIMLGFPAAATNKVVQSIIKSEPAATVEQVIKLALKQL